MNVMQQFILIIFINVSGLVIIMSLLIELLNKKEENMLELYYIKRGKKITCIITEYKGRDCKTLYHAISDVENALKFLCDTKEIYLKFLEEQENDK